MEVFAGKPPGFEEGLHQAEQEDGCEFEQYEPNKRAGLLQSEGALRQLLEDLPAPGVEREAEDEYVFELHARAREAGTVGFVFGFVQPQETTQNSTAGFIGEDQYSREKKCGSAQPLDRQKPQPAQEEVEELYHWKGEAEEQEEGQVDPTVEGEDVEVPRLHPQKPEK